MYSHRISNNYGKLVGEITIVLFSLYFSIMCFMSSYILSRSGYMCMRKTRILNYKGMSLSKAESNIEFNIMTECMTIRLNCLYSLSSSCLMHLK